MQFPWKFYKVPVILSSSAIAGYRLMQASYKCEFLLDYFMAKALSKCISPNEVISVFPHRIDTHTEFLEALSNE